MRVVTQAANYKLEEVLDFADPVKDGKRPIMKVAFCGICGSDVHTWELADNNPGIVTGHEFAGVIVDPGERTDLKVGDKVIGYPITPCGECEFCKSGRDFMCGNNLYSPGIFFKHLPGAMAEYFQPMKSEYLLKVPDSVPLHVAAMAEPANIALRGCNSIDVGPGDKVLVAGGGIIGSLTAQWAKWLGADYVAMTEINKERAKVAVEFGVVDDVFDPTEEGVVEKINEKVDGGYSKGGGFNKFIDCTGAGAAIDFGVSVMKKAGKVALVGVNWKPVPIMTVNILLKQLTLVGIMSAPIAGFKTVLDAVADGSFKLEQYMTKLIPFEMDALDAAYRELHNPTNNQMKIMVKIDPTMGDKD